MCCRPEPPCRGYGRATLRVLPLHLAPSDAPLPPVAATSAATPGVTSEMTGIDLLFLSMMAGHTEQTLQIVRLVRDRLSDSELRTLVAAVEATESDELATARGWLARAGRSARADDHAGHGCATPRTPRSTRC